MKRWKAWSLATAGVLSIAGYAGWCARPFFSLPPIHAGPGVSQEMKDYIAAWQVQTRWFEAERFSWKRYVESLMHPYDSNVRPVQVRKEGDSVFDDEEHVMVFHTSRPGWVNFSKDRFGWDSPHIQTEGPPGFTTRPRRMSPGGHGLHHPDKEFQWRGIPGMGADAGR